MNYPLYYAFEVRAAGAHRRESATIYPYGPFPAGDGKTVMSACRTSGRAVFCKTVLQRPELATDPR
jgi:itaconate CoA-transferase